MVVSVFIYCSQVAAGINFNQTIGDIKFSHIESSNSWVIVTIISFITAVMVLVIIIGFCLYCNRLGPFKRKVRRYDPQVSYQGDNGGGLPLQNLLREQERSEKEPTSQNCQGQPSVAMCL